MQMVVTNYVNPMTPQQRAEIEERRKGIGFSNSRLSKENETDSKRKQELLSRDDSNVLSLDNNIARIDLSHLDKAASGADDLASGSDWTHSNGDSLSSQSDRSPR